MDINEITATLEELLIRVQRLEKRLASLMAEEPQQA